ncbi:MAG: hypothetical protein ACUVT3_09000, partial [Ignavibacterium sp.]
FLVIIFLFLLSVLAFSCSVQSNLIGNNDSGKILLEIDRTNAPNGVTLIIATLSREGYSNITSTLNLMSDSTADLQMDNIPAGIWHLQVDAMNDSMIVLYTRETDVNILAGFVKNITLNLQPTGQGTGSIYIYVSWGGVSTTNYNWIDNQTNPVLVGGNNYYDNYGVAQPVVMYDENKYKIWYYGDSGSAKKYVLYAESENGIDWVKHPLPVLSPGNSGSWDSWAVHPGAIIKENGIYKMYYSGWADQYGEWYIGIATSVDGLNWTKKPDPILSSDSGWEYQIASCFIIKNNDRYYLYYTGRNMPYYSIGLAISSDGLNFTKYSENPILVNDKPWEGTGVLYPTIYFENNVYKMIYMNAQGTGFGLAQSTDGINWTKDQQNPFFRKEQTANGWGKSTIAYPNVIKVNNDFRIYYSGASNSYNPHYKIGFLKRTN